MSRALRSLAHRVFAPAWLCLGLSGLLPTAARADAFLSPDQAFRPAVAVQGPTQLRLHLDIAKGYYLYEERYHFASDTPGVTLGQPQFPPPAEKKFDVNLGHVVSHERGAVDIGLPVRAAPARFKLRVTYQGCADQGLCYPPVDQTVDASLAGFGGDGSARIEGQAGGLLQGLLGGAPAAGNAAVAAAAPASGASASAAAQGAGASDGTRIGAALASGRLAVIAPMFLLFGLLLAFTPCVLPMVPILSSIVVGQGETISHRRGLALALVYALGMALVYTLFGVAAGLAGRGLAAALQNPWVLSAFAALLALLSLSMFGFYELQMPAALQSRLSERSGKLQGGQFAGVFLMGGLSALIVGPCVAAPLAGALLYIGQTGNAWVGAAALFSLAAGMSLPLLVVGIGAGALLPRAGVWMDGVKAFFGVLLLATALYMLVPVLADWVQMLAWAALLMVSASHLRAFDHLPAGASGWSRVFKGLGVLLALAGALLVVGLAAGNRSLLQPLQGLAGADAAARAEAPAFRRVATLDALQGELAASGAPVLLDFDAAWCVACREMENFTFPDRRVAARIAGLTLLRADVSADTADDRALLKHFGLFGPPGIIFFKDGREIGRVVGAEDAATFLESMRRAGL
jgi:thiol:disulfide interchange protein DsbD